MAQPLSLPSFWMSASVRSPITASSAICIRKDRWTVQRSFRMQIAEDAVMGDLTLALIQKLGRESGCAMGVQDEIAAARILGTRADNDGHTAGLRHSCVG